MCVTVVKPQTLKASAKQTFSRRRQKQRESDLSDREDSRQQLISITTRFFLLDSRVSTAFTSIDVLEYVKEQIANA